MMPTPLVLVTMEVESLVPLGQWTTAVQLALATGCVLVLHDHKEELAIIGEVSRLSKGRRVPVAL
jgi:hypothetical protein